MRGGFVACTGGDSAELERIAEHLRWHRGKPERYRVHDLEVAAFVDGVDGPYFESPGHSALLVHGAVPAALSRLQERETRFAAIAWEGPVLRASRDPFGLAPLFYRVLRERIWLASEIRPLLALGPTVPHLAALTSKAAFVPLDEETGWRGIHRVLPGTTIEFTAGQPVRSARYWDPFSTLGVYRGARSDAVDALRERFSAAVSRCYAPGDAIILSGGKDSAAVALCTQGAGTEAYLAHVQFSALPRTDELRYAHAIADALSAPLHVIPGDSGPWTPGGELDVHEVPYNWLPYGIDGPVLSHLESVGITAALDGHDGDGVLGPAGGIWGELLLTGAVRRLQQLRASHGVKRVLRGIANDLVPSSWRPPGSRRLTPMQSIEPYFSARLRSRIQASDIDRWSSPATRWKTRQLQPLLPRALISFEHKELDAARHGIDLRHPFADRRMVELLVSLPCPIKADPDGAKSLMLEALGEALPETIRTRPKSDYMEVVRRRVDPAACLELIRSCGVRLPDIDYSCLFARGESDPDSIPVYLLVNLARVHEFVRRTV